LFGLLARNGNYNPISVEHIRQDLGKLASSCEHGNIGETRLQDIGFKAVRLNMILSFGYPNK
jgi:hypothetical protein